MEQKRKNSLPKSQKVRRKSVLHLQYIIKTQNFLCKIIEFYLALKQFQIGPVSHRVTRSVSTG